MALINKTIYPRFNQTISVYDLEKFYTPSEYEISFAREEVKSDLNVCVFLIILKVYNNLKYFPNDSDIPKPIINHIKNIIKVRNKSKIEFKDRSTRRYKNIIRNYFNMKSDKEFINSLIVKSVNEYEPLMESSEDIFNAVIEVLLRNNCELPSFRALNRLINEQKTKIDNNIFEFVSSNLNKSEKDFLDNMLIVKDNKFSDFNYIKELPKSPSLSHLKEVKQNYIYLKDINIGRSLINTIHPSKINNFASQVNALDASEMKDFSDNKRYTLLICFIYKSLIKTGDDLITMFIKRLGKIHSKGKDNLEQLLEKQRSKTENAINVFHRILTTSQNLDTSEFFNEFNSIIEQNGGYNNLLNDCEEITAYHNNNYYPLLPKSFKSHRSTLFEVIKLLPIRSSNKNNSLTNAIEYLLSCENRKSDFIDGSVDLSFANEKWRKFVISKSNNTEVFVRRNFEICVFSYIASEFKTGDLCAELSEEYTDYRKQLLPWNECQLMLNEYCKEMNLPNNSNEFIINLRDQLDKKAKDVDIKSPKSSELVINPNGEILLKKPKSTRNIMNIKEFKRRLESKMPERNIVEILCNIKSQ